MRGKSKRILSLVLSIGLLFQQISFAQVAAELNIANYLSRIGSNLVQEKFRPLHLRYFSYDSLNDNFKLLLDKGDLKNLGTQELQNSTKTLLNYFLVGVTLPNDTFWVNLRPDSENQIIDRALAQTDVGKIMLESDLQLKKDTAKFTSPESPEGREYWNKLYKKAEELFGYDNITIPTLTRPWIVPGEIIVRESQDSAYVYKATLKVMLEQDYLKDSAVYNFKDERSRALNEYSSQLIRELIIPKLTKEVNSSKRYAALRQVYYSLILSRWFKLRFIGKTGTYASLINTKDLTHLISQTPWSKTDYFKQYQKSFSEGEYNIKEPVYTPTGQIIRSYFSGGINVAASAINTQNGIILPKDNANKLGDVMGGRAVVDPQRISLQPAIAASPITDEFNQLPLAKQSERLRSKIRPFEDRFKKAYQVRDNLRLTELNREIVKLLNQRLKIQLQLGAAWLEVAKSDRRRLVAAINSIRGARSTSKRISAEYGWQRRRETKTMLVEKLRTVGYYGTVIETFLYKDLDIKVYAPDKEHPEGKVTIRQQRWVTLTLADGTKVKERQWRDIPYEDWPAALRSQIHTLTSQEIDYETILHYLADLEYGYERLSEYRTYLPGYIYQQIEESLINSLVWTKRGSVAGKRDASENLEFALAKLKEGANVIVLKELEKAIENLGGRLEEIEEIRRGVDRRFESVYVYIRNSDIEEKLTLLKEKLNAGLLEEAEDLASLLYQNYFTAIAKEASYNYLQKNIAAISNAIDNLKKLFQQEKLISDELTLKKRLHNALQAQIKPSKIERDKLQKRKKDGLLDEEGKVRLSELESIIKPQEEQLKNNYTAIQELASKLLNTQKAYLDNSDRLHRDIDSVKFMESQYEPNEGQKKPAEHSGSSPIRHQDAGMKTNGQEREKKEITDAELYPKAIRQDRKEEEVRFDAYADTLYRLERQIRLAYQEALQPFINRLTEISTQIKVPEEADEFNQRFDMPLRQGDESIIDKIADYYNSLSVNDRQTLYEFLQHHESALAAKALAKIGLKQASSAMNEGRASSSIESVPEETGGIDFRALPLTIQPMGSFSGLNFSLPKLSKQDLERMNLDEEMQQIENMVKCGITPSGQRIKEFIAACAQKGEINYRVDNLLLCLIDIFKLEEENAYESSPELREALVIVDSQS